MTEHFAKKQDLLAAELQQYFGRTCPALLARGQAASASLGPPSQDELNARFCELAEATRETNRQLRVDLSPVLEGASSEPFVDHALASLEHLREIAESIMRRLDELSAPS